MVIEKHEIHVAGVVHLAATEFAHPQDDRPGPHAYGLPLPCHRLAQPLHEPLLLTGHHHPQERFGIRGEGGGRFRHVLPAQNVTHPHPQLL